MKIIDVHIHFTDHEGFRETARKAGHENSAEHLRREFERLGIVMAVAMGAGRGGDVDGLSVPRAVDLGGPFDPVRYGQPEFIAFCCGVESRTLTPENARRSAALFEPMLQMKQCVGIKLYPGYNRCYLADPIHHPFYELAEKYDVPVVIHTGDTASSNGILKYAHPLTVDEVAVEFPRVRFVMAHYGNPWIIDATEVAAKNPNVFIDLSGLAVGQFAPGEFLEHYRGYLDHIRTWIAYLSDYGKLMYGSDWPLVNLESYIEVVKRLIPADHHDEVFYRNALRVFSKLVPLLPQ